MMLYEKDKSNMHFALGLAYLASKKILEAEVAFLLALENEPDYIPALHNLANVYELLGRQADADRVYLRVSDLAPHMTTIELIKHAKYDVKYLVE